jgi:hypothetical protein
MELTNVDRALKRPQQYFLEDGLWEIACGLWMVLTVALPLLVGGVAANWGWSVMLLSGLGLRPAVVAAKDRWVHPRTGHVAFPDEGLGPPPVSLGLSPAAGPAAGPVPRGWARLGASLLGMVVAIAIGVTLSLSRRAGFGEKGAHVTIGLILGAFLLVAAWRWRQRRWIGVAVALPLLGAGVASSGLGGEPALAAHAAGIGCALVVSGTAAFVSYLRRAPEPSPAANGR